MGGDDLIEISVWIEPYWVASDAQRVVIAACSDDVEVGEGKTAAAR